MTDTNDKGILEAILFAAGDSVTIEQLTKILSQNRAYVLKLAADLERDLSRRKSGLTLRRVAGGFQLVTRAEYYPYIEKLTQVTDRKLSSRTMETLSIIAFKQPITKQEIETIRGGIRVEHSLARLLEMELVRECGRKHAPGRPILYGTTEAFLQCFGLNSLSELPRLPSVEEAAANLDAEQLELLAAETEREKAAQETISPVATVESEEGRVTDEKER